METQTQTPTQTPSAGTPPVSTPSAPISPQVSEVTGKMDVTGDAFLTDDEKTSLTPPASTETPGGEGGDTPPAPTTPTEPKPGETPPATPPAPATPKLLAGKYATVQELKDAFIELGGDPSKYADETALENAYEVRQQEFTRVNQERANLDRLNQNIAAGEAQNPTIDEDGINQLLAQVPWAQVKDAKDLAGHLMRIMVNNLPKLMPQGAKPLTEEEIAAKVAPMVAEREKKLKELNDIETKVPRLKTDKPFRTAFAQYVRGQKDDGSFKNLDESMKGFVGFTQAIVDDLGKTYQENQAAKVSAGAPTEGGEAPQSTGGGAPAKDEADDIIDAFVDYKGKFQIG